MNKRNSLFSDFDKALKQISNSEEEQDKLTKEKYKKLREIDEEYSKQISNILIKREDMYKVYYKYQELIHKYSKFSISTMAYILPILMKRITGEDYTFCINKEYQVLNGSKKNSSKFFMFKSKYLDSIRDDKIILNIYPSFYINKVEKMKDDDSEIEFYAYHNNSCLNFFCGEGRVAEAFIDYLIDYKYENNIITLDDNNVLLQLLDNYLKSRKNNNMAFGMTKEEFYEMYEKTNHFSDSEELDPAVASFVTEEPKKLVKKSKKNSKK
ncbi:MAG: hypothetical protein IJ094_07045 [Bacilli bacterium]|nr:hypothetical protein [Bacilli bacterium]